MEVASRPATLAGELPSSAVSWASIAAGSVSACALTLILLAVGAGIGLSTISPWTQAGVSATTFKMGSGVYMVCTAVMSSAVGGYLAARLRSKWTDVHSNEVFFRDTAHGMLAWALATLLTASVLGSAAGTIVGGAAQGVGLAGAQATGQAEGPASVAVDRLLRPAEGTPQGVGTNPALTESARAELLRLITSSFREGDVSSTDRAYAARIVSTRTGLPPAEAEQRVAQIITDTKLALDKARRAATQLALWLAASLLLGAFAASLAAVEGGQLRDGTWEGRKLSPRQL
jgi:hypothetical protein